MIVVDSSALIAILFGEAAANAVLACFGTAETFVMSAANVVETGTVLVGRRLHDPAAALADLDRLLEVARIDIAPVDAAQARIALAARVRFGRGMGHGGLLNYGDTFAYALARSLDASLLYVGNDFRSTDIRPAIGPA